MRSGTGPDMLRMPAIHCREPAVEFALQIHPRRRPALQNESER